MRWLLSILFAAVSVQAAYVVTSSGRQINGERVRATADGSVTLFTHGGQSMTFQRGQYRAAKADRPRELDVVETLLAEGKDTHAVALLEKVKREYRFLAWDQTAIARLADYYFETGQYAAAAREYPLLDHPSDEATARLRTAILQSGDAETVRVMLDRDIASDDRVAAAYAYLARGDQKVAAGDVEGARRDWLKVKMFFKAQNEMAAEAEARLQEEM